MPVLVSELPTAWVVDTPPLSVIAPVNMAVPGKLFVVIIAPARADAPRRAALLAKHKAYVGWELGDGSIETLSLAGSLVRIDKGNVRTDVTTYRELRSGLYYRVTATSVKSGSQSQSGFVGQRFWYSDDNGFYGPRHRRPSRARPYSAA